MRRLKSQRAPNLLLRKRHPLRLSDAVGDLIARAEKEYQTGLANHQAGKIDEAKQNFDNALNALLSSNLDIRSDDRLQTEFDRIVTGVNELYPNGTAPSDTEAQQKSEPAPIDETNGLTPAPDAGIKAKAQAEIKNTHSDLPLMMTDQVAGFITYFSGRGRGVFERAFARSGRYHDMIVATLKAGRRSPRSDLSRASRIGIPSAGGVAGGGTRHLAVHGQSSPRIRSLAQHVGR